MFSRRVAMSGLGLFGASANRALCVVAAGLCGLCGASAFAQPVKDAYVRDARGVIVRNSPLGDAKIGNLCWRTAYWTPALAISECDPDIAPRPAPKSAPAAMRGSICKG